MNELLILQNQLVIMEALLKIANYLDTGAKLNLQIVRTKTKLKELEQ